MSASVKTPPPGPGFRQEATPPIEMVPVRDMVNDQSFQVRCGWNGQALKDYRALYDEGYDFEDPVELFRGEDGLLYLWDGFHRYWAALEARVDSLPARVWDHTPRRALLAAIRKNARHGLPLTGPDKRKIVEILLRDPEWKDRPAREIARHMGVSHTFVNNVKAEISGPEVPAGLLEGDEPGEDEPWGETPGEGEEPEAPEAPDVETVSISSPSREDVTDDPGALPPGNGFHPPEPAPAPTAPVIREQSDEEWLRGLPLSARLRGHPFKLFQASALCYRRWASSEISRAHHRFAKALLEDRTLGKNRGVFEAKLAGFLLMKHPRDWLFCLKCGGTGQLEGLGECDKCKGRGHVHG